MPATYMHTVTLFCVIAVGVALSWWIRHAVLTTDLVDMSDLARRDEARAPVTGTSDAKYLLESEKSWPIWFTLIVLCAGGLLALASYQSGSGFLPRLCLLTVLFSLLAITIFDLDQNAIPLDLFIPLAAGTIAWVLLHQITVWFYVVFGIMALAGLIQFFTHRLIVLKRWIYGDLALAILVGLFSGVGVTNIWQYLAEADRIVTGMCVGVLLAVLAGILARRLDEHSLEHKRPLLTAGSPTFFFVALFSVFSPLTIPFLNQLFIR